MNKRNLKILITGANGFIGHNLAEQLKHKFSTISPSHSQLDLLDRKKVKEYLKEHNPDAIIHAALYVGSDKRVFSSDMLGKNLTIFYNLLEQRHPDTKVIVFGSGAEYDKSKPIINVSEKESGLSLPKDDYGLLKYTISRIMKKTDNAVVLRLFGVYGKYEDYTRRFISQAICRSILGLPVVIRQNVFFDYIYIDDLVKIVEYCLIHNMKYTHYNAGKGEKIDLISLAEIVKKTTHNPHPIKILKQGYNMEYTCNNQRLLSELSGFKFTPFTSAIDQLYRYYLDNKSIFKKKNLNP
ncbi:NAD(P)-dependent oxidoreductase [Patescibacteria group bacterium]|nr:NAD(P)-dependent oxidoreductase [Patescibacteria group bacterium]MCL5798035.1 NAD(P)-dependent oxidoreductase [Patescibacteria group bacterium]